MHFTAYCYCLVFTELHWLTMNRTEEAETATLTTLFHVVRKGSRFLVTGLILVVLTEASYSGLVCSPSSKWLRETYSLEFQGNKL